MERIRNFSSQSEDYPRAFSVFLAHTDQKRNAMSWLQRQIARLERRDLLIDAGAGNGALTAQLSPWFARTIAVEPNPALAVELKQACPSANVIESPIGRAEPGEEADFVLCSHVLYYIDASEWTDVLRRLASWLAPGGLAAVALQNSRTDCMTMLRHFNGLSFQLEKLAEDFAAESKGRFDVEMETVPAHIRTESLESAFTIAEFMLNLVPVSPMAYRDDVERYVVDHFRQPEGNWVFSCHQDFLKVRRVR